MTNMRAILVAILSCSFLLATIALVAQDIPPDEIFWGSRPYVPEIVGSAAIRVQSDLVEVPTVVRDSHGNPVGDLKKEDFILYDNGKPQTISTFSVLTGPDTTANPTSGSTPNITPSLQPRYIALYFDEINASAANLNLAREGAIKFVRKGLAPGERIGIFTASGTLNLDFTDDVQKLLDALAKLRRFLRMSDQAPNACPLETTYQAWVIVHLPHSTDEFRAAASAAAGCGCKSDPENCAMSQAEAIVNVAEKFSLDTLDSVTHVIRHLGDMPGRRVLVLASSGFLTLSLVQKQEKVIEAALRAHVVINSLDTAGLPVALQRFDTHFMMSTPMSNLASETGGQFIHNTNDLAGGFQALSAAPSITYLLGFSPTDLRSDGTQHSLKVKLAKTDHATVNARPAYYAPSPDLSPSEKRFRKLEQSVLAADSPTDIPIQFAVTTEILPSGDSSLKVVVHVDIRKLNFDRTSDARHLERLIFITALFDAKNQFLTGVQGVMDLRLKEATLKQISAQGLDAKLSIQAPAGSYRVRQVVQEAVGGHITAISRDVTIH
jgi:VWFA-related protein